MENVKNQSSSHFTGMISCQNVHSIIEKYFKYYVKHIFSSVDSLKYAYEYYLRMQTGMFLEI